jgi:hypothetical protein
VRVTPLGATTRIPVAAPAGGARVYLVLEDCVADAAPGNLFYAYLGSVDEAHRVGTFNYFNMVRSPRTLRLGDVTDIARKVAAERGAWQLIITTDQAPAPGSNPVVGRVLLVAQ